MNMRHAIALTAVFACSAAFAPEAAALCKECGTVTNVRTVKKEGEASGVGAVAGGVIGGVVGGPDVVDHRRHRHCWINRNGYRRCAWG